MNKSILKSPLSLLLLKKILLVSGCLTIILTCFQLALSYGERKQEMEQFLRDIERVHGQPISRAVFELDASGVELIATGIQSYDFISYVSVTGLGKKPTDKIEVGHPIRKGGELAFLSPELSGFFGGFSVEHTFDLNYGFDNNDAKVGEVKLVTSDALLLNELKNDAFIILVSQAFKTLIVSAFLLSVFYSLIVSRIISIHKWLLNYSPDEEFLPVEFGRKKLLHDEIEELKNGVNSVGESLRKHNIELESIVEQRTEALITRTEELEEAKTELEHLAYTDSLTSVANRLAFFKQAEREIKRARRLSYDIGIMMLDLDYFKKINDTYGHEAGDEVLIKAAEALKNCLRENDCIGRIGGEEFAIIVSGAEKSGMHNLASRLRKSIQTLKFSFLGNEQNITISIGYTVVNVGESFKVSLKRADKHLYSAKENGRNCFVTDKNYVVNIA